ncbi:hypothetical protein [Desulfitobacterium metallireducens]|uniref:DUF4145 domain-containing protein n=1 Tax=Desulfitobacterium metallireducens DSM 15288 TaxID=871968 RepID=W0EEF8_9FIRM|nr:hypothetical protein [Desulfitobacterium metallireducens]AHF07594.1 hypothetical protein DESME_11670 [Desulfitobacterium metallireducens DSM 15288]
MPGFNNSTYESLVKDLINDAFYLEARSRRGTIATIRQYSEVIVRRILNLSNEDFVTLGNRNILSAINEQSQNNPLLLGALSIITNIGNKCTHSKNIECITKEDVNDVINSLFELYSYLLTSYFEKYEFGSNMEILSSFSILPPIIRYITLKYLNDKYPENIIIIDKLALAILKAFDKEKAFNWIEERKETLSNTPSVSKRAEQDLEEKIGKELASIIIAEAPNMYDLCNERIRMVGNILEQKGKLYDDFEGAIDHYYEKGIVQGETPDVLEFNSIMEFLYLGRKSRRNELLKERDSYLVIDNIFKEF